MHSPSDEARRRFWTLHLDRAHDMLCATRDYPLQESLEPFASIRQAVDDAGIEMLFADSKIAGVYDRIYYVRAGLIPHLLEIGRDMNARGWILKIEDGFRTRDMQTALGRTPALFDKIVAMCQFENHGQLPSLELVSRRQSCMVANYPVVGTHMCGAAVDISVYRRGDGSEVWRGASYLEMSEVTPMDSPFVSPQEQADRYEITGVMEKHGFVHYPGEFWHYNQGDALWQLVKKTGRPAPYAPVHWDPDTNTVTPYQYPYAPLTPPELMQQNLQLALQRLGHSLPGQSAIA